MARTTDYVGARISFGSRFLILILLLSACSSSEDDGDDALGGADAGAGGSTAEAGASGDEGGAGSGPEEDAGPCAPVATVEQAVAVYGEAWNVSEAEERLCMLRRSVADDVTYIDPTIDTMTVEALSDAIGEFQTTFADGSIVMRTGLDMRAGELRFGWDFVSAGASLVLGEDSRLTSIRGWLTGPDGLDATGAAPISIAIGDLGVTDAIVVGVQAYPKFARVTMTLTLGDGTTRTVTDYTHLDGTGKMTRIGRFEGDFPALP